MINATVEAAGVRTDRAGIFIFRPLSLQLDSGAVPFLGLGLAALGGFAWSGSTKARHEGLAQFGGDAV